MTLARITSEVTPPSAGSASVTNSAKTNLNGGLTSGGKVGKFHHEPSRKWKWLEIGENYDTYRCPIG